MLCITCTEIIYYLVFTVQLLCFWYICSLCVVLAENMTLRSIKVFLSMILLKKLLAYVLIGWTDGFHPGIFLHECNILWTYPPLISPPFFYSILPLFFFSFRDSNPPSCVHISNVFLTVMDIKYYLLVDSTKIDIYDNKLSFSLGFWY